MKNRSSIYFLIIFITTSCSMAGWEGSFIPKINENDFNKKLQFNPEQEDERLESMRRIKFITSSGKDEGILLPTCSTFFIGGLFTPFTPPLPFFWPRILAFNDDPCNYMGVKSSKELKMALKYKDVLYDPIKYDKDKKIYIFPIRAKDIDSGSIIIETNGEKIEVPFEYKYLKFWY